MKDAMSKTQSVWRWRLLNSKAKRSSTSARTAVEIGAFENEFSKIDGDAAFDLRQKMEHAVGQMRNDVEQYPSSESDPNCCSNRLSTTEELIDPVLSVSEIYFRD